MIAAAVFLNAILCTDESRTQCKPAEFMYSMPETYSAAERAAGCRQMALALSEAQEDKAVFYRCDSVKGA